MLFSEEKSYDKQDIIARGFHLKVKKIMALLTKGKIFGEVCCFKFSTVMTETGLPHLHRLLRMVNRISPDMVGALMY